MKFEVRIGDVGKALDGATTEALRRLGFEFDHDAVRGLWQERPLGAPVIELTDLDMLVRFSEEWGPLRIEGASITLLAPAARMSDPPRV